MANVASPRSEALFIEDSRQQRAGLVLRDVRYRLYAEFEFIPADKRTRILNPSPEWLTDGEEQELYRQAEARPDEKEAKYAAMFDRRATKGQCFTQPYLGCREFSCSFQLVKHPEEELDRPIQENKELGWMLYDLDYADPNDIKPMFYRPTMVNGVIEVPDVNSEEVRK